mmetsp:Transcript_34076/g.45039  ORF Transcript_34076/g.45039 Transcript_34076/m.45039 type:complete len:99 (-) Transcript_34076:587-883(-)
MNTFSFKKDLPIPLADYCRIFIQSKEIYEEYLQRIKKHNVCMGEWSSEGDSSEREITFSHRVTSVPVPDYLSSFETKLVQKYSIIGDEILVLNEFFFF